MKYNIKSNYVQNYYVEKKAQNYSIRNNIPYNLLTTYNRSNNFIMGYKPPKVSSSQISSNIALTGIPTTVTPSLDTINNQIASTKFVHDVAISRTTQLKSEIMDLLPSEISENTTFHNIHDDTYYITTERKLIIETPSTIHLPSNASSGTNIVIFNASENNTTIKTQNNELMFNSFFLPYYGSTTLIANKKSTCNFMCIINNTTNVKSWTLNIF